MVNKPGVRVGGPAIFSPSMTGSRTSSCLDSWFCSCSNLSSKQPPRLFHRGVKAGWAEIQAKRFNGKTWPRFWKKTHEAGWNQPKISVSFIGARVFDLQGTIFEKKPWDFSFLMFFLCLKLLGLESYTFQGTKCGKNGPSNWDLLIPPLEKKTVCTFCAP